MDGKTYMFIGHQKGRNTKENIARNFGMPIPHGPEACAAILWKSSKASPKATERLRITAQEHYRLGIADGIIPISRHSILGLNGLNRKWLPHISDKGVRYPSNIDLSPVEISRL
ncbi:hypothetical protein PIB30_008327 [Stylosanthes scabra]|uniref:acetyl-CoA carboxytransferase n=1 Tax=Stylosanthes scabra TaxID=79078 RepID=A0ABU6T4R4_9FABA|nr:hypothetical protein [Stylosanthes scabra]